jgi:hypothetical protein
VGGFAILAFMMAVLITSQGRIFPQGSLGLGYPFMQYEHKPVSLYRGPNAFMNVIASAATG